MNNLEQDLKQILSDEELLINEPLSKHTTFRIGGEASWYVKPSSIERLKDVISYCRNHEIRYYVLGKGSNVLFLDEGFAGVVIELGNQLSQTRFLSEGTIEAEAGISLAKLAQILAKESLTGFEFASGIPGTLGGAVAMNAGAYGGEIKDCIVSARVLDKEGNEKTLSKEELKLGYRTSAVQTEGYLVLSAVLAFEKGNGDTIYETMKELNGRRKEKQPLEYPSAGSTFKRPEGYFAGKLIQDAGLRGYRVGDAMVSEKHCGFVVNVGHATAKDVVQLIENVQRSVEEKFDVKLEPEVRLIK